MHFKATADESKPGQAEVETNASSFQHHSQHQALRNMLQGVDLNENQRQMLRGGREATNAVSPAQVRGWVHFLGLYQRTKVSTVTVSTCRSYDYYVEKSASHVLFALLHRVLSI